MLKQAYVGVGRAIPYPGSTLSIWRFENDYGHFFPTSVITSTVERVEKESENVFCVETRNSIYYV